MRSSAQRWLAALQCYEKKEEVDFSEAQNRHLGLSGRKMNASGGEDGRVNGRESGPICRVSMYGGKKACIQRHVQN